MADNDQILEHELVGEVNVFRLRMSMLEDGTPLIALEHELDKFLDSAHESPMVVINLGSVEYLVTTALAKLVSFRGKISDLGGRLILCGLRPAVKDVMRITRFDELFEICDGESKAIERM